MRGRPKLPRDREKVFWRGIGAGLGFAGAAALAGVSDSTARDWFAEAGGVKPDLVDPSGRQLTFTDREEIAVLLARGCSRAEIARRLGRHRSTLGREIGLGTVRAATGYRASVAQAKADGRARRPQRRRLEPDSALWLHVCAQLRLKHSPEQIAGRLREDFPDDAEMWVSHETIYKAIFVQGRGELRRELAACLRTRRAVRRPRRAVGHRDGRGRNRIPDMVNISERPAEAADRAVPGHWEGDLITGAENKSAIGTLVERSSGFVNLLHLPKRHGALEVQEAMIESLSKLPPGLRKTVTWDQGQEMANHAKITLATDVKIYFCDPHSPWQRPSNENTVSVERGSVGLESVRLVLAARGDSREY